MAASLPQQPSPATISAAVVPGSQTCHIPDAIPAKKAALLIGICDKKVLKGPHTDVKMMQELLVDVYGYAPENVTVLLDDEQDEHIQPTKDNILAEIDNLVRGAHAGDQFFFHFAGHAGQGNDINLEEEDGKDEFIISSDQEWIKDDDLYKRLVEPLPPKTKLTAIIDACHSGTILDLKHHKCNQVYVPWMSKGRRGTKTMWSRVVKKHSIISTNSMKATLVDGNLIESSMADTHPPCVATKRGTPLSIITNMSSNLEDNHILDSPGHNVECSSPIPRFCDGFTCRESSPNTEEPERADVICLSSSQDSQTTWETPTGASMSQILVKFLRQNPNPVLQDLMIHICHAIHQTLIDIHDKSRDYKRKFESYNAKHLKLREQRSRHSQPDPAKQKRKSDPKSPGLNRPKKSRKGNNGRRIKAKFSEKPAPVAVEVEMTNFQDPALSSHLPLDLQNRLWDM